MARRWRHWATEMNTSLTVAVYWVCGSKPSIGSRRLSLLLPLHLLAVKWSLPTKRIIFFKISKHWLNVKVRIRMMHLINTFVNRRYFSRFSIVIMNIVCLWQCAWWWYVLTTIQYLWSNSCMHNFITNAARYQWRQPYRCTRPSMIHCYAAQRTSWIKYELKQYFCSTLTCPHAADSSTLSTASNK